MNGDKRIEDLERQVEELEERVAIMSEQCEIIPDKEGMTPDIDGGGVIWYFCCGECRRSIQKDWKFCPECGKRVKWE